MAFDYGSINLGIKNPFKTEGAVQSLRGTVVAALGIYLLFIAAQKVQTDQLVGWIIVLFGLGLLGNGIKVLSQGIIAMMRYYVGRSHPTSLAYNRSRSETTRSEEHTSELQSRPHLVCRLLLEKKKKQKNSIAAWNKNKPYKHHNIHTDIYPRQQDTCSGHRNSV